MSQPVYLLDVNVLIAVGTWNHPASAEVASWLAGVEHFATCPITEGGLVRYLVRHREPQNAIREVLASWANKASHEFWPDSLPYLQVDLGRVVGHRQVTDAYLVSLAKRHKGILATLDRGLAQAHPDHTVLIA
ncbi:MAG: PIN domain-containing protein [Bifidobacteriaceae bacterium]|jgi:toxin-antitoxin system PIN domain toxin|nr:PIN domain-containing protein [Bifidobacteriaceae bacterium]